MKKLLLAFFLLAELTWSEHAALSFALNSRFGNDHIIASNYPVLIVPNDGEKSASFIRKVVETYYDNDKTRLVFEDQLRAADLKGVEYLAGFQFEETEEKYTKYKHLQNALRLIVDKDTNLRLESKVNTARAMNRLREKYRDAPEALDKINRHFPETGVLDSLESLDALIARFKEQGVVLKHDVSSCGVGVVILDRDTIANAQAENRVHQLVVDRMGRISDIPSLEKALKSEEVTWQSYIPFEKEGGLQYFREGQEPFRMILAGYAFSEDATYRGSYFTGKDQLGVFDSWSDEIRESITFVVDELMKEKALLAGYPEGLDTEGLRLHFFDASFAIVRLNGQEVPVITEINARATATLPILMDLLKKPVENQEKGAFFLVSDYVFIPDSLTGEAVFEIFDKNYRAFFVNEDEPCRIYPVKFTLARNLQAMSVSLVFKPVAYEDKEKYFSQIKWFTHFLQRQIFVEGLAAARKGGDLLESPGKTCERACQ